MRTRWVAVALTCLVVSFAARASAMDERLLAMVPARAQIVSGTRIAPEATTGDRMSLVVHDNNVDMNDWLALVGVDPGLAGSEMVEVAASSPRGELRERLLLASGRFDAEHIYGSALAGGASGAEFAGVRVVILLPFAREKGEDVGVRWLAIPDGRTAIFGTPLLVQEALKRRAAHMEVDVRLASRLKQVRGDADDWSIVSMTADVFGRHVGTRCRAVEALEAITGPDELVLSFRYGRSGTTIDFGARVRANFPKLGGSAADTAQMVEVALKQDTRVHFQRIEMNGGWVSGTVTVNKGSEKVHPDELAAR